MNSPSGWTPLDEKPPGERAPMGHSAEYNSKLNTGDQTVNTTTQVESQASAQDQQTPEDEGQGIQTEAPGSPTHPSDDPGWTPRVTQMPLREDLDFLYERGCHFLPVWGKDQLASGWQFNRATPAEVLAHLAKGPDGLGRHPQLGIKPMGLKMVVVDIDAKSEAELARLTAETVRSCGDPVLVVPSRKPWGRHLYYYAVPEECRYSEHDGGRYHNGKLFANKEGDVRGTSGYLILWNPAEVIPRLRDAVLARGPDSPVLTPATLDALRTRNLREASGPSSTGGKGRRDATTYRGGRGHNARVKAVRDAVEGSRNDTLYQMLVRAYAAGESDMTDYAEAARSTGLGEDEIRATLDSAAKSRAAAGAAAAGDPGGEEGAVTLESLTRASRENSTEAASAFRFLVDHSHRLVVAYDPDDRDPADVYAYTTQGTLSVGPLEGMLLETSRKHMAQVKALPKNEPGRQEIVRHSQKSDDAHRLPTVITNIRGAIYLLRKLDLLPENLVIKRRRDINSNLRYMGAPNGVIDLHTGKLLPADEARATFTAAQIPDDYDPQATHPDVDVIMPEEPTSPEMAWWSEARGYMFANPPSKQFIVMLTPPHSGKTVWANCDQDAFGPSYVTIIRPQTLQRSDNYGPTSYNDGLMKFGGGMRVLYQPECKGDQDLGLINLVTGGDRGFPVRRIKQAEEMMLSTAHLVQQSNLPREGAPDLRFGITSTSDDDEVQAFRERMHLLPMPVIPEDQRNPLYLTISATNTPGSPAFRQAWVARTVRQCMAMAAKPWPQRLESQAQAMDDLRRRETDPWVTEWLENLLVEESGAEVNSREIYGSYEQWHEDNGGQKQTKRTVTAAVTKRFGPSHESKKVPSSGGRRTNAVVWHGLRFRGED